MITKKNLKTNMQLSINCYMGKHGNVIELLTDKVESIIDDGGSKSACITGWVGNDYYISFEGTNGTFKEWMDNLNFKKSKIFFNTGKFKLRCHKGFQDHYKLFYDFVHKQIALNLDKLRTNYGRIYITGHSLGGPVSTLCFLDIMFNYWIDLDYTNSIYNIPFASPRLFGVMSALKVDKMFKKNIIRVIYRNDIVPKVPMSWKVIGFFFKHIGIRVWLDKMSKKEVMKHLWARYIGRIKHHYPEKYLATIEKLPEEWSV